MTTNRIPADLSTLNFDRLAIAYGIADDRAHAADRQSAACTRAMNLRERIGDEASRRGAVIRRLSDGRFACGRPADFEPIR